VTQAFDPSAPAAPESGLFGLNTAFEDAAVQILGVPIDATTSFRRGTAGGPAAILAASHQIDLFDPLTGHPYRQGIHMPSLEAGLIELNRLAGQLALPVIQAGGAGDSKQLLAAINKVDRAQEGVNHWVDAQVRAGLEAGQLVGLVGGDHSVPLASIVAHAERHPDMGILHFDAHADLRVAYEGFEYSHASIMHNVLSGAPGVSKLLQVGLRDLCEEEYQAIEASNGRVEAIFDHEWASLRMQGADLQQFVRESIAKLPQEVYISFDIDGLDPSLCPSTGTPVPGGLLWPEAMLWLEELARSGRRIVGFDLCEVSPTPGQPAGHGWDEIVGARLLYRLIGFALMTR